ncbi:MAG: branched-chain amino acid transport system ATP-binding protein [Streptosporangiaceae bacterium]|jgi:branched-chain amino acid transport system ATP-binding protein|nr:branched-chain amino acid transport system ATP-binding protein [Streptosporangiaceae bacterium]
MTALELRDVTVRYGAVRALSDVTLTAAKGAITAVLGANGAGKSTLLRTVSGLVRPVSGSITYNGRTITAGRVEDISRMGLAHVPEGRGIITELTVEENLRLGGLIRRQGRKATASRASRAAERSEAMSTVFELFPVLYERRRRTATTLSGGERQMLAIGRALMCRPSVLLLDEPSLGLAPRVVAQIMTVLRRLRDESGYTVLLVEQNARSALSIADRAVVLNLGEVVIDDDAHRIAGDDQLRRAYLGF